MSEPDSLSARKEMGVARSNSCDEQDVRIVFSRRGAADSRSPLTTPERLLEAGWREADALPLAKAFSGVTTASVAGRAGVTTGSFFHHFRNGAEFADAMALAHCVPEPTPGEEEHPLDRSELAEFIDLVELIRIALTDTWAEGVTDETFQARFRYEMRLWSFHQAQLSQPTASFRSVADIIKRNYRVRQSQASVIWVDALDRSGRELLAPYDVPTVATVVSALYEGLLLRAAVDPEAVGPDLFARATAALVDSITGPAGVKASFDESSVQLTGAEERSPQARSGARRRHDNWVRVVSATTGMFADGWENVSATEIADRARMSPQTVLNLFHSVQRVAAATFRKHATELYAAALSADADDPVAGLRQTLRNLAGRIMIDPEAARALLAERVEAGLHRGPSMEDLDIRIEVPIGAAVGLWVSRLGIGGERATAVSAAICNFVLSATLSRGLETSEVVEMALRMLPDGVAASGPADQS